MGIISNLISNYASTKAEESRQKTQEQLQNIEILKTIIADPRADPQKSAMAQGMLLNLAMKGGGKQAKEALPQITSLMAAQNYMRGLAGRPQGGADPLSTGGAQPGAQGQPASMAGAAPAAANVPGVDRSQMAFPPQAAQIPGVSPAELAFPPVAGQADPQAQQQIAAGQTAARQLAGQPSPEMAPYGTSYPLQAPRSRLGSVLGGLAGTVGEVFGRPRPQPGMQLPAELAGGWEMSPEQMIAQGRKEYQAAGGTDPEAESEYALTRSIRAARLPSFQEQERADMIEALGHKPSAAEKAHIDQVIQGRGRAVNLPGRFGQRADAQYVVDNPDEYDPSYVKAAQQTLKYLDSQDALEADRQKVAERQAKTGDPIVPGTTTFAVAQQLAYGDLTFQQFTSLYPNYREGSDIRSRIYAKALELNPNFNAAQFAAGFKFTENRQTRAQLGALDNVAANVNDLVRLSDEAERTGFTKMNQYVEQAGYNFGGQTYTDFAGALKLFGDELSGALGYGTASDLKTKLGLDITDGNLGPDQFRSRMQEIMRFVTNKHLSLTGQMGPYGPAEEKTFERAAGTGGTTGPGQFGGPAPTGGGAPPATGGTPPPATRPGTAGELWKKLGRPDLAK